MNIKYPKEHLSEIRERFQTILQLSHRNRLDSNSAASSEMLAEAIPHARDHNLSVARSIREQITQRKAKIEKHKQWIEEKAPGFFAKIFFVRDHITTWDLDLPAIRLTPSRWRETIRKKHPEELTLEKREASLAKRRSTMNQWYCFFCGDDHLKPSPLHED